MAAPEPAIAETANERLFQAVASADKDKVRRLLEAGANPKAANEDGVKVLHRTALRCLDRRKELQLVMSGKDGDDAKPYQEKQVMKQL